MPESSYIPSAIAKSSSKPATLPVPNPSASFWLSDLDPVLKSHRTTPDLPSFAETVIIGSGITGATAAWDLAQSSPKPPSSIDKAHVLVLEAREACSGATGRNGGHLQPLLYDTTPDIAAFELKNCEEVAKFIAEHEIKCEYRSVTACRSFWTQALRDSNKHALRRLKETAPDLAGRVRWFEDFASFDEAQLRHNCLAATLTEGAASLWPYKYVAWRLRHLVQSEKINLQTHTPVESIRPVAASVGDDTGARYHVHTNRGTVLARNVLLATNAYTSHLLPNLASLIVPVRETMTALHPPETLRRQRLHHSHGLVGTSHLPKPGSDEYLISRPYGPTANVNGEGHLMLGGARTTANKLPHFGESDDSIVDPAVVEYLRKVIPRTMTFEPSSTSQSQQQLLDLERAWTGIWGQSRDGAPWVGPAPLMPKGLWICGGYSGHGMPNASLCASAVVKMILAQNEDGGDTKQEDIYNRLVSNNELPRSYLITEERLMRAGRMPEAAELDELGLWPLQWLQDQGWA